MWIFENCSCMNYHILIVEDDFGIRETLADLLESFGYEVASAQNGYEGWKELEHLVPDLIISDVMMPVMDGIKLLELTKTSTDYCTIPFIMLTARVDDELKNQSFNIGADAYITKPFDTDHLLFQINYQLILRDSINRCDLAEEDSIFALKHHNFINDLNTAIQSNLGDSSLTRISQAMELSPSGLQKKIKLHTDHTFSDYLKRYKLSNAKALLESGKCNVSQTSHMSGFKNLAHFSESFKEHFGVPPSKVVVQK